MLLYIILLDSHLSIMLLRLDNHLLAPNDVLEMEHSNDGLFSDFIIPLKTKELSQSLINEILAIVIVC